jgi:hypothetical protein
MLMVHVLDDKYSSGYKAIIVCPTAANNDGLIPTGIFIVIKIMIHRHVLTMCFSKSRLWLLMHQLIFVKKKYQMQIFFFVTSISLGYLISMLFYYFSIYLSNNNFMVSQKVYIIFSNIIIKSHSFTNYIN